MNKSDVPSVVGSRTYQLEYELSPYLFVNLNILFIRFQRVFFHNWRDKILCAFEYVSRWSVEQLSCSSRLNRRGCVWCAVYTPPFVLPSFLSSVLTTSSLLPSYIMHLEGLLFSFSRVYLHLSLTNVKTKVIYLFFPLRILGTMTIYTTNKLHVK